MQFIYKYRWVIPSYIYLLHVLFFFNELGKHTW